MSLDAIKKSIHSEAEAKASAIDSDASSQAKSVLKEAEDKAKSILDGAAHNARIEAERLVKEAQAGAETEANSLMLEAKGAAIERALKKVSSQMEDVISKNYSKKLFDSGLKQFKDVSNSAPIIITGKRNAPMFKGSKYNVEYSDVNGFIFSTDDRKISLNATVPSVVEKSLDVARKLISKELFGEGHQSKPAGAKRPKATGTKKRAKSSKGKKNGKKRK